MLVFGLGAAQAEQKPDEAKGPPVVLPTIVVIGHQIPTSWMEVSWECANPLPFCPIKRAWISKVGWETPAAKAGVKRGDELLVYDRRGIGKFTSEDLRADLLRGRNVGDRLELVLQTPGQEPRTVAILFERP